MNVFESELSAKNPEYILDHVVYGKVIMPGAGYVEMALAAGFEILGAPSAVKEISIERPLVFNGDKSVKIQIKVGEEENGLMAFEIFSHSEEGGWRTHASGKISLATPFERSEESLAEIKSRMNQNVSVDEIYNTYRTGGIEYGPNFRAIQSVKRGKGELLAEIKLPAGLQSQTNSYRLHPVILDNCLQSTGSLHESLTSEKPIYLPVSFEDINVQAQHGDRVWCHVTGSTSDVVGGKTISSDLVIFNDNSEKIAEVKNFTSALASKADLFKALGIETQEAKVGGKEWFYGVDWVKKEITTSKKESVKASWIVFSDKSGMSERLEKLAGVQGTKLHLISSTQQGEVLEKELEDKITQIINVAKTSGQVITNMIHLTSLDMNKHRVDMSGEELLNLQQTGYGSALAVAKVILKKFGAKPPRLNFVTSGAVQLEGDKNSNIEQSPVWGLSRVLLMEHPELKSKMMDLDSLQTPEQMADLIFKELSQAEDEPQIIYRSGSRMLARLNKKKLETTASVKVNPEGSYLITGGLGGLGLRMGIWLADQGAKHLVLMGRKEPAADSKTIIENLRARGVQVSIALGDVAKEQDLSAVIAKMKADKTPDFKGVIHAAGVIEDASLMKQTWGSFEKVMSPKVKGGWNLHKLTRDIKLDFFVLFSSTTSVLGNQGQANYGAANLFLDSLASYRKNLGLPGVSINWGPWAEVGMAKEMNEKSKEQLSQAGLTLISVNQGQETLGKIINSNFSHLAVIPIDWSKNLVTVPDLLVKTYLSSFASLKKTAPKEKKEASALQKKVQAALESERKAIVTKFLVDHVAKLIGARPEDGAIDTSKGLMSLGLDSLAAIEFRNKLKKELNFSFSATLIFTYPTIDALVDHLLTSVLIVEKVEGAEASKAVHPATTKAKKSSTAKENDPIVIVGMSCRFPGGANDLESFWEMLSQGKSGIVEVPKERWNIDDYYDPDPDVPNKIATRRGGFISGIGIDEFDPEFFGITKVEANYSEPGVRMLLETAWEALEDAGETKAKIFGGQTGLFVGSTMWQDYKEVLRGSKSDLSQFEFFALNIAFGRLSYFLGAQGPMLTTDTACSSSLVAIDLACESLRSGNCERAIVVGLNILGLRSFMQMSRAHALSPTGESLTFDEKANGYVRAEGCGVIILKRMSEAIASGDRIQAVIRGSAIMHGGRSVSPTAPNGKAQEELINHAFENAGIKAKDVSYIEAHGTGTPLGDPLEMQALTGVMKNKRDSARPLYVSSVKSNFGHTEGAAGIAGLIKTVLAMEHNKIPPHLGMKKLNPNINLTDIPAKIPMELTNWPEYDGPKLAGVSSFGMTGTIAHVVIEEAPKPRVINKVKSVERPLQVLVLSGRNESALKALANRYVKFLSQDNLPVLSNICFTASEGRTHFDERLAVVGKTPQEMKAKITKFLEGELEAGVSRAKVIGKDTITEELVYLFSGQGSQYFGMGKELYDSQPTFKKAIDHCAKILNSYLELPILSVIWGENKEKLNETAYTQPALFVIEYALSELWRSWGVEPSAVMGHSVGELVAACVAGVFSLEDGIKLIAKRGQLMQKLTGDCGMGVVSADGEQVLAAIQTYGNKLSIAAYNGPTNTSISGDRNSIREVLKKFEAQGLKVKELAVSHGFHSSQMDGMLDEFEKVASEINYFAPKIKLISNLTGARVTEEIICKPKYWRSHVREAVRFEHGIKAIWNEGYRRYLEIGAGTTLGGMGQSCIESSDEGSWLTSFKKDRPEWEQLLESVGSLYTSGVRFDWKRFETDTPTRSKVKLPTYPFQRQKYWVETKEIHLGQGMSEMVHPLLWRRMAAANGENIFESDLSASSPSYLKDHVVYGNVIMPGTGYVEMALAAGFEIFGSSSEVREMSIERPLVFRDQKSVKVQLLVSPEKNGITEFEVLSRSEKQEWKTHATGKLARASKFEFAEDALADIKTRCTEVVSTEQLYKKYESGGLEYGPNFRAIQSIRRAKGELLAEIHLPKEVQLPGGKHQIHPIILDNCLQATGVLHKFGAGEQHIYLPVSFEEINVQAQHGDRVWCHVTGTTSDVVGGKTISSDLVIYNDSSEKIAEVKNFTSARASKADLLKALGGGAQDEKEIFYETEWIQKDLPVATKNQEKESWIIFTDKVGIGDELVKMGTVPERRIFTVMAEPELEKNEKRIEEVVSGLLLNPEMKEYPLSHVVHLWSLNIKSIGSMLSSEELGESQRLGYGSALALTKAILSKLEAKPPKLTFITSGAQQVFTEKISNLAQAPLWGFAKVLTVECPELKPKIVDTENSSTKDIQAAEILKEIVQFDDETQIAYRGGLRQVARLSRKKLDFSEKVKISSDGSYLVTGGLGGLGLRMAVWLADQGAKHLLLMGRNAPQSESKILIESLLEKGVKITIALGDVSKEQDVAAIIAKLKKDGEPDLKGVIHAAGVIADAFLPNQNWESFEKVMSPKIKGSWNLHHYTQDMKLDLFVLFSSTTALLGNQGQCNYGAANSYLDALARFRKSQGLKGLSVNWGPWAEVGMAKEMDEKSRELMSLAGLSLISVEKGRESLGRAINSERSQICVLPIEWNKYLIKTPENLTNSFFGQFAPQRRVIELVKPEKKAKKTGSALQLKVLGASESERKEMVTKFLVDHVVSIIGAKKDVAIDTSKGLMTLGMDSLTALELRNRLKKDLNYPFTVKLIFNYPTIDALTEFLLRSVLVEEEKKARG